MTTIEFLGGSGEFLSGFCLRGTCPGRDRRIPSGGRRCPTRGGHVSLIAGVFFHNWLNCHYSTLASLLPFKHFWEVYGLEGCRDVVCRP